MSVADRITEVIEKAVEVPALPQAVAKLAQIIADPDHDRSDVIRIIKADPALVADSLRAANSAGIRRSKRMIATPEAALALLGEQWLVRVVVARSAGVLHASLPGYGLAQRGLWDASIRMAVASELLATRAGVVPQVAYTAALIADVGKLVLSDFLARVRGELVRALRGPVSFDAVERSLLGLDHAELSARLAEAWEFPESIVTAMRYHHRPSEAPEHEALCHVVHAGDHIAALTGCALGIDGLQYRVTNDPLPELILEADDVDRITTTVESRVEDLERSLEL